MCTYTLVFMKKLIMLLLFLLQNTSLYHHEFAECSTITPHMPNLSGMGGSMLDGPMRPQIVHEPKVRRKSSIFRKIRDKLRRGSLVSSSTADSAQSAQSTASASSSGKLDFQRFKIKYFILKEYVSQDILHSQCSWVRLSWAS